MRVPIDLDSTAMDAMLKMSEGNPGAATVVAELFKQPNGGLITLMHLDDMNMRGAQIWVAYKDHFEGDIEALTNGINKRDPEMVAAVNEHAGAGEEIAVTHKDAPRNAVETHPMGFVKLQEDIVDLQNIDRQIFAKRKRYPINKQGDICIFLIWHTLAFTATNERGSFEHLVRDAGIQYKTHRGSGYSLLSVKVEDLDRFVQEWTKRPIADIVLAPYEA